ncbi:Stk1 family PASTA domain-containing Ser/Thr kinase [Pseudolysinimonas yzui]|uniref:non-specific serine/threonine protein kinase n=1 Tax=Pseudolysinimonas yzui TaxID=2708254 RepID=A0A8J3M5E0_9MICO|nr:Stk1 family PASTA domain-containing Ser/Thr kinase [Pseudolysinimonas yzui]GHF21330.1 putative serine/threonine-protein kinase [Pseudolysinimonas yzui]
MTDTSAGPQLLAGRYQIGELLGRGGMADVHLGLDARLGRKVAIKLLKPSLANDPAFRTRFRQEAQAAARMAHPTIVRVYDAGEEIARDSSGRELQVPFIVMEHVEGHLLKDLVAKGPMSAEQASHIVDGILTALEYSHRAGVVHRDIKPGNVMVTSTGQVKVMDFGIARAISDSSATIAQTSAILGTAQYFSPEQARGEAVDARTDLYSTGVVLYELLTGKPPFHGETAVATAYQHVSEAPTPPSRVNSAVTPALDAVVMHALAKDRFERFQSAGDFKRDLEAAVAGKLPDRQLVPVDDFSSTLFGVNPSTGAASEAALRRLADDDNDDRMPRTQSRPPVAWIWGGIAMFVVILVAAVFWVFSLQSQNIVGPGAAVDVPDVVGINIDQGTDILEEAGLEISQTTRSDENIPEGEIMEQTPEAGTRVSPGQEVRLVVSSGAPLVEVPSLVFMDQEAAKAKLAELELVYGTTTVTYSPNVPSGGVMGIMVEDSSEVVTASTQVPAGSTINLVVSNGLVVVPDLKGQPITTAQATLKSGSLQLGVKLVLDNSCTGQTVVSQSVIGEVPQKSSVTLTYCSG